VKDDRLYLIHILERIARVDSYIGGDREAFFQSSLIQDAILRNLEIIGAAAKRVSAPIRERYPDIPWRLLGGFRDVLIHRYNGVDLEEVWNIIANDLPILKAQLRAILEDLGPI
jgi:uncharacterized protein with HEPN domain